LLKSASAHAQASAYIKGLGFSVEMMSEATAKAKVAIDRLVSEKAGAICSSHYDGSPEQQGRLTHVLSILSDLFFRGAAIEPAKLPPVNTDSGFPDVGRLLEEADHPKLLAPEADAPKKIPG